MKKLKKKSIIGIIIVIIFLSYVKINSTSDRSPDSATSFSQEISRLHNSDTQALYGHSAFGVRGWSRQGDSITFSFDASSNIWVYAMDESQWNSFTEQNMLGTQLSTGASDSGIFSPQYESRWYIVFFNYHSYSVSVTYDVTFSPIIRITNPTSSTQIFTESELLVLWESYGGITGGITIDLYKGSSFIATLDDSTINDGYQYCQIPETCIDGINYRIRLASSSEVDYSDYFTIIQRKLIVSRPLAGAVFVPHTTGRIEWIGTGTSALVNIDLYANNSFLLNIVNETQDDDEFLWTVGLGTNYASDSHYQFRVEDAINPKYFDFGPNFTILSERFLTILNPIYNSSFKAGSSISVQWETDTPCDEVIIELIQNNNTIKQVITDNTLSYDLLIPSRVGGAKDYQIHITAADNSTFACSAFFTIIPRLRVPGYEISIVLVSFALVSLCFFIRKIKVR